MLAVGDAAAADDTDLYDSLFCHVVVLLIYHEQNAAAYTAAACVADTHILPHFGRFFNGFGRVFGSLAGCTKWEGVFWAKWRLTVGNSK